MQTRSPFKLLISLLFLINGIWNLSAQKYQFTVDLLNVQDDEIMVELILPELDLDSLIFQLPRIVPGTYSVYDFGKFVQELKAYDDKGNELMVSQNSLSTWLLVEAKRTHKLVYWVEDSWDTKNQNQFVFEPAGTNFEEGENFVINAHAILGYLEGHAELPFEVTYLKPADFFGATSLERKGGNRKKDIFISSNYFNLVDAPVMYAKADTAVFFVGGAEILIALYSSSKETSAKAIAGKIKRILEAQKDYLGGELPIKKYAFLIYLFKGFGGSGAYGALEHNYSSFYFLPEFYASFLAQTIRDFATHEFFHILTPLNIHSEEIHFFDFMNPEMSRHLWLYEGVTEYAAGHVQVREGLISIGEYFEMLKEKLQDANEVYKDELSFTELSLGCLDEYEDQYGNVYQKGALIGLCLDLILLKESKGEYSLRDLMHELAELYGPEKPFVDTQLFTVIDTLTFPSVGKFLREHVGGGEPIPYGKYFEYAGLEYHENYRWSAFSMGGMDFEFTEEGLIEITGTWGMNEFGKRLGIREGDIWIEFNGVEINQENATVLINRFYDEAQEGDPFSLKVRRAKGKKVKEMELNIELFKVEKREAYYLEEMKKLSPEQLIIKKAWLGNYKEE